MYPNGRIRWSYVDTLEKIPSLHFVFIRLLLEKIGKIFNLIKLVYAKENKMIRVYHYYRPNENSIEQAALY
jgi:lysozyme